MQGVRCSLLLFPFVCRSTRATCLPNHKHKLSAEAPGAPHCVPFPTLVSSTCSACYLASKCPTQLTKGLIGCPVPPLQTDMLMRGVDARGRALQVKAVEAECAERGSRLVRSKNAKERQKLDEQRRKALEEACAKVRGGC